MKRKLSAIEQMIDANIVYAIRIEGRVTPDQLSSTLARVQRKHPALRAVLCREPDGLYYEEDCAPEISLRVVPYRSEEDHRRECQTELTTIFSDGQPQLRAVWLQSEPESELLLTTSHRICDGMSMLIIVREVLHALHSKEELIPYAPITPQDMIGDYRPPKPWKRRLAAYLLNGMLQMLPNSRRPGENKEYFLEWGDGHALLNTLKQHCKTEGVSIHAALVVALDRALLTVLGTKKLPEWIENPIDARRGRLAALKSDVIFFGGGGFKVRAGQAVEAEFWTKARSVHEEMRGKIEQELLDIPSRYHFHQMLRPLSSGKIQSIVRLGDALKMNGSWNRIALSNLGNLTFGGGDAPFQVKDLRLYMHSFNIRLLCLVTYTFNGEMRFYYVGDEKCLSRSQADALKREFIAVLGREIFRAESSAAEFFPIAPRDRQNYVSGDRMRSGAISRGQS